MQCQGDVRLQILGSGGPELNDSRASSSYLLWLDQKARLLLDVGSGASFRFDEAEAQFQHVDAVLLSHLHTDHSVDLPSFIKGAYFTSRKQDLLVIGPKGNGRVPATSEFVARLIADDGAFSYLSDYLKPQTEAFKVMAIDANGNVQKPFQRSFSWGTVTAIGVHHGPIPALAWRIEMAGCTLVYTGDMSNKSKQLADFARGADVLLAHMAIPENAGPIARSLHMPPSAIARIVKTAKPSLLVLSHFMRRSERSLQNSLTLINRALINGNNGVNVLLAEDLMQVPLSLHVDAELP